MPPTPAAPERCQPHRFDPADPGVLASTKAWCPCGLMHRHVRTAYACTGPGCEYLVFLPLSGGHR